LGSKTDEVTEEWGKLHNEELNDMYCSTNIIRVMNNEMGGACSTCVGKKKSTQSISRET